MMSTLSGRQQLRIRHNIAKEVVETQIKRRKILKNVTIDENEDKSNVTLDSSPSSRLTDSCDTSSASDSSEIICSITKGNESNAVNDFSNESCGISDCDRDVGDVNISVPDDNIENDRNFNVDVEDDISDSENNTASSSPDSINENVEDVYSDSSVQYNSAYSDSEI